jgi:hypothetical protein
VGNHACDDVAKQKMTYKNWREIAGHLYDELRLRGVTECLFNHADMCGCEIINCIEEYELADGDD